jgi:hypothetical protein
LSPVGEISNLLAGVSLAPDLSGVMVLVLLLLASLARSASGTETIVSNLGEITVATVNCPCIDPNQFSSQWRDVGTTFKDVSCISMANSNHSHKTCELGYGALQCLKWDEYSTDPVCTNDDKAAAYCGHKFCYVDPNNCNVPYDRSAYFPGLYYSYQMCGYLNDFSDNDNYEEVKKLMPSIRVSFPVGSSGGTYTVMRDPISGELVGSVVEFAKLMFEQPAHNLSIRWDFREISAESKAQHPQSLYTACVKDVALGKTDLCIGDFWQTTERLIMSSFTIAIFSEGQCP